MGSSESKPAETSVVEVPVETAAPAEAETTPAAPSETPVEAPAAPSEAETTPEAPAETTDAPVETSEAPAAPAETEVAKKKPSCKACCACPETKLVRDKCIIENGAENCEELIAAHLKCMRDMGFNI